MARTTLADVAAASGVSLGTASKALNPHADRCDLSPETRDRVLTAAHALGFVPSRSHAVRGRRLWRTVGLLWGNVAPYTLGVYENLLTTIGGLLAESGWHMLHTPVVDAGSWIEAQRLQHLDGILAISHAPPAILRSMAENRYPSALLNLVSEEPLPQFVPDEEGGAAALVDHLADLGHHDLVYLQAGWPGEFHFSEKARREGIAAAARRRGVRLNLLRPGQFDLIRRRCCEDTTALICYDWQDVPPLMAALREAGLAVPEDVSVACCCDVSWFAHLTPALTATRIPILELAGQAVAHLLDGLRLGSWREAAPTRVVMPTTLTVRASSGPRRNRR